MSESTLRVGVVAPEVLATYGDLGNALVLVERARRRGIDAEIVRVPLFEPVPNSLDIYALGGGEDTAQALAAAHLREDPGLSQAAAAGKPILAVCAAFQVLGKWYVDANGSRINGVGLLDAVTIPRDGRVVGEVIAHPVLAGLTKPLLGFENHIGRTRLGPDASPLGLVRAGVGNGEHGPEGAVQGSIIGTYLHGPVLARNPQLADLLLERAVGHPLAPLPMASVERLRAELLSQ